MSAKLYLDGIYNWFITDFLLHALFIFNFNWKRDIFIIPSIMMYHISIQPEPPPQPYPPI